MFKNEMATGFRTSHGDKSAFSNKDLISNKELISNKDLSHMSTARLFKSRTPK